MSDTKLKYHKIQSICPSVELPKLKSIHSKFVARVFFKDCDRLPDPHSGRSYIKFFKKAWDKEKLRALLDGVTLTSEQKEQILLHDSYAELAREIDGDSEQKAGEAFWRMIEPLANLCEKRVGVQFMEFAYPQFFRTAFFNSLNLVGTKFSLSEDGCLTYTSRGLHEFGVHEVEYVLPKKMHGDFDRRCPAWMNARTTEDMITLAMSDEFSGIRLILPFRHILNQMLLNQIPLEPGVYRDFDDAKASYRIEQCVLSTGQAGIRMTSIPSIELGN
ncbi:MAG: hypothetical protein Q4A24_10360 [Akkermansia sp.]|nr:hypothetical protein [Akkermansia sp.]